MIKIYITLPLTYQSIGIAACSVLTVSSDSDSTSTRALQSNILTVATIMDTPSTMPAI